MKSLANKIKASHKVAQPKNKREIYFSWVLLFSSRIFANKPYHPTKIDFHAQKACSVSPACDAV